VHLTIPIYSIRVTKGYRAVGQRTENLRAFLHSFAVLVGSQRIAVEATCNKNQFCPFELSPLSFELPKKDRPMKPLLIALTVTLFLLLPAPGFTDYIIHLKDGTKFVTDQYVEEGDLIKFKRYGGLVGIEKDRIREIEETAVQLPEKKIVHNEAEVPTVGAEVAHKDNAVKPSKAPGEQPAEPDEETIGTNAEEKEVRKPPGDMSKEEREKAEEEETAKKAKFLDEKRRITRDLEEARSAFMEAKEKSNQAEKEKWWLERGRLRMKLSELEKQVKLDNGGRLPDWWEF